MKNWKKSPKERGLRVHIGKYVNLIKKSYDKKDLDYVRFYAYVLTMKIDELNKILLNNAQPK